MLAEGELLQLSSLCRSTAVDESCQSLLSHTDISYDHTEDDVVRSVPAVSPRAHPSSEGLVLPHFCRGTAPLCIHAWGGLLSELEGNAGGAGALMQPQTPAAFQDVDMTVVRTLKRKVSDRQV